MVAKILDLQHQFFQWIFRVDFSLGLTGLISLLSKGLSRVFSSTTVWEHQFFGAQPSLWSNSHSCTWLPKHSFDHMDLCWQSVISAFNTLSRFVIAFLPRSKCLLISLLKWNFTVHSVFWSPRNKVFHFLLFPLYLQWSDGTRCHDLRLMNVEF